MKKLEEFNVNRFLILWNSVSNDKKFNYRLNIILTGFVIILLSVIWIIFFYIKRNFNLYFINFIGIIYLAINLYIIISFFILLWRVKTDGIIINENFIIWKNGRKVYKADWDKIDKKGIIFSDERFDQRFEGSIQIPVKGEIYKIIIYNPFYRLKNINLFLRELLNKMK